jgi:hypothetical protein
MRRLKVLGVAVERILAGSLAGIILVGCSEQAEPRSSPIVARRLGGDSLQPGPMVVRCRPEDAGCVPTYAVACPAPPSGDSTEAATLMGPPLSPQEEAWCAANANVPAAGARR